MDKTYLTIIVSASIAFVTTLVTNWLKVYFDKTTHKSKSYYDKQVPITSDLFVQLNTLYKELEYISFNGHTKNAVEFCELQRVELFKAKQFYSNNIMYFDKPSRKMINSFFLKCGGYLYFVVINNKQLHSKSDKTQNKELEDGEFQKGTLERLQEIKKHFDKIENRFSEVIK